MHVVRHADPFEMQIPVHWVVMHAELRCSYHVDYLGFRTRSSLYSGDEACK